ncbi:MAG: choice-of-anchor V domain-containing protein [Candidatus Thermoplasmatota archaeon]
MRRALLRVLVTTAFLAAGIVVVLTLAPLADANPHGIVGYAQQGCICHGASPTTSVRPILTGVPQEYRPGETYTLTVAMDGGPPVDIDHGGHAGGFGLKATGGDLEIPRAIAGEDVIIKSEKGGTWHDMTVGGHGMTPFDAWTYGELSFGHVGANQRTWEMKWSPPDTGAGEVTFYLAVLSANGDHLNSTADQWGTMTLATQEGAPLPLLEQYSGTITVLTVSLVVFAAASGGYVYARKKREAKLPTRRKRHK